MPVSMSDVLRRVLDNANLGKAIADVGPGFALSVPLLMLIALTTGVSVLPADRLTLLNRQISQAERDVQSARAGFKELVSGVAGQDAAATCDAGTDSPSAKADRCHALALRTLADLGSDIEAYAVAMKDPSKNKAEIERLTPIRKSNDKLLAHKEAHDAAAARLQTLENQRTDHESLQYNLVTFTDNTAAFIAFAVILGILLSQLCHLVFIDLVYAKLSAVRQAEKTPITIEQILSKQDEELVTHYFRYTEGAINMVVPVLLLGFVFPAYAQERLGYPIGAWTFRIAAVVIAVALIYSGYQTYLNFVQKRRDLALAAKGGSVTLIPKV